MARYTNKVTGVHVSVADEKVLGSDWEPDEKPKRTAKKADATSD